jgi:hypothetical protein
MPIDTSGNPITLALPFTVDISGLEAQLFGTAMTLCGAVIPVTEALKCSAFYSADASAGWIHYVQSLSEDSFEAYINSECASGVIAEFKNAVRIVDGSIYNLTHKGLINLDVSGAEVGWTAPFNGFYSLQDFVLSYMANKIFGHPGALAPIKNDSGLRASIASKFHDGLQVLYGASGCAIKQSVVEHNVAGVATNIVPAVVQGSVTSVVGGLTQNDLQAIVQQVMNLDSKRFHDEDSKGRLNALPILPNDKLHLQIRLRDNKYKLFTPTNVADTSAMAEGTVSGAPAAGPVAAQAQANSSTTSLTDDTYYVLEFTMSA